MRYVFVTYDHLPAFKTPESWYSHTTIYNGILRILARDNEVISVNRIGYKGIAHHDDVTYHFTGFKNGLFSPLQFNRYIKNLQADVVIINGTHYPLQVMQLRLLLGNKVKIAVQHHAEQPFTGLKKHLQRMADHFINAYFFSSAEMGQDWVKRGNLASAGKIHTVMEVSSIFYPVDKNDALAITAASGYPLFIWVGRLNANKDPLNVLRAFLRYADHVPGATLNLFYHTTELLEQMKALLADHPNKNAIKLMGKVSHDKLLYWYNSTDFILSGSYYEGANTAVCEAMSCGCIPIVTAIPSFRMMTDNGRCGYLYEPGDEKALLRLLLQTNTINHEQKRQECILYFKQKLSFEAIAETLHQTLSSL